MACFRLAVGSTCFELPVYKSEYLAIAGHWLTGYVMGIKILSWSLDSH